MVVRVRFGVRVPIFPNAGILIFRVDEDTYSALYAAVKQLRTALNRAGEFKLADRLVCEIAIT